mmetsp:Transcript_7629/g.10994  ORF Transcript_7629/g.10994 Transcript_7629/m.10994 type:complete len:85 (+) Transcript_7629:248-502(+)
MQQKQAVAKAMSVAKNTRHVCMREWLLPSAYGQTDSGLPKHSLAREKQGDREHTEIDEAPLFLNREDGRYLPTRGKEAGSGNGV